MASATPPNFGKSIVKITILTADPATNQVKPVVYYSKSSKKKRGSKRLRLLERIVRYGAEAPKAVLDDYLERHKRSNERKRDGWLRDEGKNAFKSIKAGRKKLEELQDEDDD